MPFITCIRDIKELLVANIACTPDKDPNNAAAHQAKPFSLAFSTAF